MTNGGKKWQQPPKQIAESEVSLRMRELKEQLYDHVLSVIEAKMIKRRTLYKIPESEVSNKNYTNLIALGVIGSVMEPQASKFGFITATGTSPATKT